MSEAKYKLLFADDDLIDRPYLVIPFEDAGFNVDIATSGLEAYNKLKTKRYDVLVLDNMMLLGGDDGTEWSSKNPTDALETGLKLVKKMADLEYQPKTWVLTALPDTEVRQQQLQFPFVVKHIMKDFSLKELAQIIKNYLEKKVDKDG